MFKNIALVILALCCAYLLFTKEAEKSRYLAEEISPAEYGGLASLRDIIPQDQYRNIIMPYLQGALSDGKMSRLEMQELGKKLPLLGAMSLEASQKVRPQDALAKALEDTKQSASDLGSQLSRGLNDALNDLSKKMDDAMRSFDPSINKSGPADNSDTPAHI